jgi:glycosyltransferase involved in cell wall biosynthesis
VKIAFLTRDSREHFKDYSNQRPYFGTAPQALLAGFEELGEPEVHVISCVRAPVASPEKIGRNIFYHSLLVHYFSRLRMGYIGSRWAIGKLLAEIRPDVVHGQGTEHENAIAAASSGFPNLITIHGNMRRIARLSNSRPFSHGWALAKLEAVAVKRADGVLCITQHTVREVKDSARKVWTVPNAVDEAFFSVKRGVAPQPTFVCVGNIWALKNQLTLITAFDEIARERAIRLVFAGKTEPSEYGAEFERVAKERPWCEVRGFVKPQGLRELLAGATALIHPSREENCPMVILEAMAAGVPVLASRVGGIPELVSAETGWLFDPEKPEEIGAAVRELFASPERAAAMGEAARAEALKRFHPARVAAAHVEIYRELLSGSRRAAS